MVGKSTVPVGTAARLQATLHELAGPDAELAWNPEFLREGFAVEDTLRPDRLVFGVRGARAEAVLREVYAETIGRGTPVVVTDYATAELVKTSANAFLATKISFINAVADICDQAGADVATLADAIGYDARIGRRFLNAGLGYGGGCLPKDVRAFRARADELGVGDALDFLTGVEAVNAASPRPGGRADPRAARCGARCLPCRAPGRRPGGGVQAALRRHPRLARPRRRPAARRGGRRGDRPRPRRRRTGQSDRPPAAVRRHHARGGDRRGRRAPPDRVAGVPRRRPGRARRGGRPDQRHRRAATASTATPGPQPAGPTSDSAAPGARRHEPASA